MGKSNYVTNKITNSVFKAFGRSCNLIWFCLKKGDQEVCIHCQCFVRVSFNEKIITTSEEIYRPHDSLSDEEKDIFEWDMFGKSAFDVKMKELINASRPERVVSFEQSGHDFRIIFNNGMLVEILEIRSDDYENWRMFVKYGKNKVSKHHFFYDNFEIE